MYDKSFLDNINKLFLKKNFNEVILNIEENNHFLENYPDLFNVSGVSKILKLNYNKSDVISALNDFENYLGGTSGNLMKLAAQIIGENDQHVLSLAYDMGMVWGLIGTIRSIRYHISLNKVSFSQDVLDEYKVQKKDIFAMDENENIKSMVKGLCTSAEQYLAQITNEKKCLSKEVRSLFLHCALSKSYLNALKKVDYDPFKLDEKSSTFPRQCRLFFSALFGVL